MKAPVFQRLLTVFTNIEFLKIGLKFKLEKRRKKEKTEKKKIQIRTIIANICNSIYKLYANYFYIY